MSTDIRRFPSLSAEEFIETCHHLDRRYCQAELGALRLHWKLRLCTVMLPEFVLNDIPNTYVQITRVLEAPKELDLDLSSLSLSEEEQSLVADQGLMDLEESDQVLINKPEDRPGKICGFVTYEIHLHPTYRMPCLWFRISSLTTGESQYNLDTVFQLLVPDAYKDGLRRYNGVGGISMDVSSLFVIYEKYGYGTSMKLGTVGGTRRRLLTPLKHHPVSGHPWFFVHPCLAGDQMSAFECSREDYLTIWLGLVGGCVGLWIPKEMVLK